MRSKFIILVLCLIRDNIETYNLDREIRPGYITVRCSLNETISLDKMASIRNEIQNITKIYLQFCRSMSFAQLTETLGMNINKTSKVLRLEYINDIKAEDLTGIDEHGVKLFLHCYASKDLLFTGSNFIPPFDTFSTIPKLKELFIIFEHDFKDNEYQIPDLSKLSQLELLSVTILDVVKPKSKLD